MYLDALEHQGPNPVVAGLWQGTIVRLQLRLFPGIADDHSWVQWRGLHCIASIVIMVCFSNTSSCICKNTRHIWYLGTWQWPWQLVQAWCVASLSTFSTLYAECITQYFSEMVTKVEASNMQPIQRIGHIWQHFAAHQIHHHLRLLHDASDHHLQTNSEMLQKWQDLQWRNFQPCQCWASLQTSYISHWISQTPVEQIIPKRWKPYLHLPKTIPRVSTLIPPAGAIHQEYLLWKTFLACHLLWRSHEQVC